MDSVKISLSAADILNLNSTPVSLCAAKGAGTIIVPIAVIADYAYGTTGYSSSILQFSVNGNIVSRDISIISSTSNSIHSLVSAPGAEQTVADNQPIMITANTNPTGGDGTMDVTLLYEVVTR